MLGFLLLYHIHVFIGVVCNEVSSNCKTVLVVEEMWPR